MPTIGFTSHLLRFVPCPPARVEGATVREALDAVFADNRSLRGYVVDERGALRKHISVFIDNEPVRDREGLTDLVGPDSEIYVLQALSGG